MEGSKFHTESRSRILVTPRYRVLCVARHQRPNRPLSMPNFPFLNINYSISNATINIPLKVNPYAMPNNSPNSLTFTKEIQCEIASPPSTSRTVTQFATEAVLKDRTFRSISMAVAHHSRPRNPRVHYRLRLRQTLTRLRETKSLITHQELANSR